MKELLVYPHVCGAASHGAVSRSKRRGLSPRVWGSPAGLAHRTMSKGSIPTCVGQPSAYVPTAGDLEVYPHVCGAAPAQRRKRREEYGLSPRVWGSLYQVCYAVPSRRSIPTCVGQPHDEILVFLLHEVYPHVCGAAYATGNADGSEEGLSPRVWGSRQGGCDCSQEDGSIPTCVGQPKCSSLPTISRAVYPHVCGAALKIFSRHGIPYGLSPRVWGSL